jgi:hypothetical protein
MLVANLEDGVNGWKNLTKATRLVLPQGVPANHSPIRIKSSAVVGKICWKMAVLIRHPKYPNNTVE